MNSSKFGGVIPTAMAALGTLQRHLLRLQVTTVFNSCSFHLGIPLCFHTTSKVQKLKKNLSPQLVNKKRKKLQQALTKLQRKGERVLKPIEENEVSVALRRDVRAGTRERDRNVYTSEELESHVLLTKEWARYRIRQHHVEMKVLQRMEAAQQKALEKLKEESEELYEQAIQCDESFIPYVFKGPTNTPSKENYFALEGAYQDLTNYFEEDPGLLNDLDIFKKKK